MDPSQFPIHSEENQSFLPDHNILDHPYHYSFPVPVIYSILPVMIQTPEGSINNFIQVAPFPMQVEPHKRAVPVADLMLASESDVQACEPLIMNESSLEPVQLPHLGSGEKLISMAGPMHESLNGGPFATPIQSHLPQPVPLLKLTAPGERAIVNTSGPPPSKENEVFIGYLPNGVFEDEIFSVFNNIGPVYKVRVKVNFSGESKHYGFVQYYNEEDVPRAISYLNKFKFPDSRRGIRVMKSVNNKRLFIHNLPKRLDAKSIYWWAVNGVNILGLVGVECPMHILTKVNRGYCIMEFETHLDAMFARKAMLANPGMLFPGHLVNVKWDNPKLHA